MDHKEARPKVHKIHTAFNSEPVKMIVGISIARVRVREREEKREEKREERTEERREEIEKGKKVIRSQSCKCWFSVSMRSAYIVSKLRLNIMNMRHEYIFMGLCHTHTQQIYATNKCPYHSIILNNKSCGILSACTSVDGPTFGRPKRERI